MTPENIPMPNSSILVSYIATKLTLPCQLFYLYPKSNYLIVIKILQGKYFISISFMDVETTMMKWMGQGLFKAWCFRVVEVLNGDGGGFVWWSTLVTPATQEGEASDLEAQA